MPKKFIKQYLPHPKKIKEHRYLQIFGKLLHGENLWHLNRRSVSMGVAVGLFCAFVPIPFQMVLAAGIAIITQANIPISVALVWITNPITMPAIFYFTYRVGTWLLDSTPKKINVEFTPEWISHSMSHIWKPLFLGSILCGILLAIIGYASTRLLWRWHVTSAWKNRKQRRKSESC